MGPPSDPPNWLNLISGLRGGRGQKRIARRERVALEVFQHRSVQLVGPRSRDHIDLPADRAAILRRQDALDDLHLGDRLDTQDLDLVLAAIVAEAAVFRVGLGAAAVHGDGAAAVADAVHAKRPAASDRIVGRTDTRAQQDDVLQIPPGDRDLGHLSANDLDLRGRGRLNERCLFHDRHGLRQHAHFERVGLPDFLTCAEVQPLAGVSLEPRQLNPYRVWARRKCWQRDSPRPSVTASLVRFVP
jgi:hypothetical protein